MKNADLHAEGLYRGEGNSVVLDPGIQFTITIRTY